eukprot:2519808-Rhodomonas_salina.1
MPSRYTLGSAVSVEKAGSVWMSSGLAESTAGPRSVSCSHCLTLSTSVVYSDWSILVLGSHGDAETT